jgi:hypothetical protein
MVRQSLFVILRSDFLIALTHIIAYLMTALVGIVISTRGAWGHHHQRKELSSLEQHSMAITDMINSLLVIQPYHSTQSGSRGRVVGWGTMLQAGRSRVRFPMSSLQFFSWPNPSSNIVAMGSTQRLTEMGTRNLSGVKGGRSLRLTSPWTITIKIETAISS